MDGFDVGLIKLNKKAKFKRPLVAEKSIGVSRGIYLTAAGWGITEEGKPSSVLRYADKLIYLPRDDCQRVLRESPDGDKDITIKDHMICAGLYEMDTCQGKMQTTTAAICVSGSSSIRSVFLQVTQEDRCYWQTHLWVLLPTEIPSWTVWLVSRPSGRRTATPNCRQCI